MGRSVSGDWILTRRLRTLEQFAVSHGLDWEETAARFKLDPKAGYDAEATMPITTMFAISDYIARQTNIDSMGFIIGDTVPVGFASTLDYIAIAAPSLRQGLKNWVSFSALSSGGITFSFEEQGGQGIFEWLVPDRYGPKSHYLFGVSAFFVRRIQYITGINDLDVVIEFTVSAPRVTSDFQKEMGNRLRFDRDHDRIFIPEEYLSMAHHTAEPNLYRMVEEAAISELKARAEEGDFLFEVCELLGAAIKNGNHGLKDIASELGMTPRTLQRRLAENGTTLRDLTEDVRKNLAGHYLKDTNLPLSEIAFLLGFSDLSSFSRSARAWYGIGPRAYRRSAAS